MGRIISLFIILITCTLAQAQGTHFFKISKNGHTSYLLGTYHYGISTDEINPQIRSLHRDSQLHFYETNPPRESIEDFLDTPNNPTRFLEAGFIHPPEKNSDYLSQANVEKAVALGVPRPIARKLANNHCNIFLARNIIFSGQSMDFELMSQTYRMGKAPIALDTPGLREQAYARDKSLNGTSTDSAVSCHLTNDILKNPKELKEADQVLKKIMETYKKGQRHQQIKDVEKAEFARFRNKAWVKSLTPKLNRYNSFITVGHGHLHGPYGLVELLKKKGFKVSPMPFKPTANTVIEKADLTAQ